MSPAIVDAVEDLIGPNILCRSSGWLVKESGSGSYVGWHQVLAVQLRQGSAMLYGHAFTGSPSGYSPATRSGSAV